MEYVLFKGEKFQVINYTLDLRGLSINEINQISNLENLKTIISLDLQDNDITSIYGLEKLSSLQILNLQENKIAEISGLDKLENLKELNLSNNKIKHITGLTYLNNLKILELNFNEIENISGLENLTNLEVLTLNDNKINKISGLDFLKNLRELYLNNNEIKLIENISKLVNLLIIDLGSNPINKITGFEYLNNLKYIKLNETLIQKELIDKLGGRNDEYGSNFVKEPKNFVKYCQGEYIEYNGKFYYSNDKILQLNNLEIENINDIRRLSKLYYLENLDLKGNKIKDIIGLDTLVNLKYLYLSNNQIEEINNLNTLTKLELLALNGNQITEIANLDKLKHLKHLNLSNNRLSEIKGLKNLKHITELALSNNKITSVKDLQILTNLEELHLADNQISEIQGLSNLGKLKIINLENNRITSYTGFEKLRDLEVLNLNNNSISKIEYLNLYVNLKELYLANNEICTIEGLENLLKLKKIKLENNNIDGNLLDLLRLSDNNPRLFVSYCILEPIIVNIKEKMVWSDLINKYPYLKHVNYDELRKITNKFRCTEVQIGANYEIQTIVTPKYLVKELDEILEPFPEVKDVNYSFITEKLRLINDAAAKKICGYIIKNELSKFPLYESEKGISKIEKRLLKHQLAIYDTPNQTYFFKKRHFRYRLSQIESFISSKKKTNCQIYKYAFITDRVIRENNAAINFLEQDSDWHLIYVSKEDKETDVDAKLQNFVNDLNNLYSKEWDRIYLITLDRSLINFFLTTYKPFPRTEIYIISPSTEDLLRFKLGLKKYEEHDFDINIFYRA